MCDDRLFDYEYILSSATLSGRVLVILVDSVHSSVHRIGSAAKWQRLSGLPDFTPYLTTRVPIHNNRRPQRCAILHANAHAFSQYKMKVLHDVFDRFSVLSASSL